MSDQTNVSISLGRQYIRLTNFGANGPMICEENIEILILNRIERQWMPSICQGKITHRHYLPVQLLKIITENCIFDIRNKTVILYGLSVQ